MNLHPLRLLRALLLAAALFVAQWVLVQHEAQIEAHTAHTSCEWCLTHAPLSGGPVASTAAIPAVAPAMAIVESRISSPIGGTSPVYQTRAPPAVLPV